MNNFQTWTDTVQQALNTSILQLLEFLPKLIGAILIFTIGLLIASLVRTLVMRLLTVAQLEPFAEKVGLNKILRGIGTQITAQEVIGEIVRWAIIFVFLVPASEVLGLMQLSRLINNLVDYIPSVVVSVVILMVGAIVADILGEVVRGASHAVGTSTSRVMGITAKYAVIIFSVMIALNELGIGSSIILALVWGMVGMIALAGGLAFGLGGKDTAAEILDSFKKTLKQKSD